MMSVYGPALEGVGVVVVHVGSAVCRSVHVCEDLENEKLLSDYLAPFGYEFKTRLQFDCCFVRGDGPTRLLPIR